MASVLVVGGPGSGKSSVAADLKQRGVHAIDADWVIARWEDLAGAPVTYPADAQRTWFDANRWRWIPDRIERILADAREQTVVVCGTADNLGDYLTRFDLLVLLQIDAATMAQRLVDPDRDNDFGKTEVTLNLSLATRARDETAMLAAGAHPVDATRPLSAVTEAVVQVMTAAGIRW